MKVSPRKWIPEETKARFFLRNLGRGLLIFGVFIVAYLLFERSGGFENAPWLAPITSKPHLVFGIYTFSEVFFGIFPPEIFMVWGLQYKSTWLYVLIVMALAAISYLAGWFNFWLGLRLRKVVRVRWFMQRYMYRYLVYLKRYGNLLIITACVTPLPYAAICLLVGTVNYPKQLFIRYTLFRILRFALYAYLVFVASPK